MFLYIVKFDNLPNKIKIGRTSDFERRSKGLEKDFGKIIAAVLVEYDAILENLEKDLHDYFRKYRREEYLGVGRTEFYCKSCYDRSIDFLAGRGYIQEQVSIPEYNQVRSEILRLDAYRSVNKLSKYLTQFSEKYPRSITISVLEDCYDSVKNDTSRLILLNYL